MIAPDFAPIPLADWRERVLALYRPPLRGRSTFINMRRALKLFTALPGLETTADINAVALARFVSSRHGVENPNTTRTHMRRLSAACTIAHAEGWMRSSPFAYRKHWVRGVTPVVPPVHSREAIARVLDLAAAEVLAAEPLYLWKARRLYALVALVAFTGLRRNEALTLRVDDILLHERVVVLKQHIGGVLKTEAASQPVPMAPPLVTILQGWLAFLGRSEWTFPNQTRVNPWLGGRSGYTPLDNIRALGERAGVEGMSFTSLRHSWASNAEHWGLTDAQIMRCLRHTNLRTQWHYRHAELDNLRAMAERIEFRHEGGGRGPDAIAGDPPALPTPATSLTYPANVEYRPIPGFPDHRLGDDGLVWTTLRPKGYSRPDDLLPGSWRKLIPDAVADEATGWRGDVFTLWRDGRGHKRTLDTLWAAVFPGAPAPPPPPPPAPSPVKVDAGAVYAAFIAGRPVEYRPIPGYPRHRLGSDETAWTDLRRDGHEGMGHPPGPWRELRKNIRGGEASVNLRRDGKTRPRRIAALMRKVFPESRLR